jgi:hypothetical protein
MDWFILYLLQELTIGVKTQPKVILMALFLLIKISKSEKGEITMPDLELQYSLGSSNTQACQKVKQLDIFDVEINGVRATKYKLSQKALDKINELNKKVMLTGDIK